MVLDVIHRAAKRKIVPDEETFKELRELRNAITHEYADEELVKLFKMVFKATPTVFSVQKLAEQYCHQKFGTKIS